jgi:hypothetical protein
MGKNEFLLPEELGWACNDEISDYLDKWVDMLLENKLTIGSGAMMWSVAKAELMDNIYAIIKNYKGVEVGKS